MGLFKRSSNGAGSATAVLARPGGGGGGDEGPDDVAVLRKVLGQYPPGHRLRMGERCRCPQCGMQSLVKVGGRAAPPTHRCADCNIAWQITAHALDVVGAEIDHGEAELQRVLTRLAGHRALQLLLVEDDPVDTKRFLTILEPVIPHAVEVFHTDNLYDAMLNARLGFDASLIDVNLPDSEGLDTVRTFRERCGDLVACFATEDSDTAAILRDDGIPVLTKFDLDARIRRHHLGTAEVLEMLIDAIAVGTRRPANVE